MGEEEQGKDVLLECLMDPGEQAWIQRDLNVPMGCWREVVECDDIGKLPVTYKFRSKGRGLDKTLRMDDILNSGRRTPAPERTQSEPTQETNMSPYRRRLKGIGPTQLDLWGFGRKGIDLKDSQFPASTDRTLYWAADS